MDLVLHVGLPKTATTAIQNHVLAGLPGYSGKGEADGGRTRTPDVTQELHELATRHATMTPQEVRRRTHEWVTNACHLADRSGGHARLIISRESLSNMRINDKARLRWPIRATPARWNHPHRRSRPLPIARYLRDHLVPCWEPIGRVRVCITLRNKPEWLASLYSNMSHKIASASAADFRHQVTRLIEQQDPFLDHFGNVSDLEQAVGADNLLVLLYEEISMDRFWLDFGDFFCPGVDVVQRFGGGGLPKVRVLSQEGSNRWKVRPSDFRLQPWFDAGFDRVWPDDRVPGIRRLARPVVSACSRPLDPIARWYFDGRGRTTEFELTSDTRASILRHCADSNQRLAEHLGRDLSHLGY